MMSHGNARAFFANSIVPMSFILTGSARLGWIVGHEVALRLWGTLPSAYLWWLAKVQALQSPPLTYWRENSPKRKETTIKALANMKRSCGVSLVVSREALSGLLPHSRRKRNGAYSFAIK